MDRYIGIDYSGAQTPEARLNGLRVFMADRATSPFEVAPARKHWARREIAEWLQGKLSEDVATLVGIDHGFSFPLQYFEKYDLALNWPAFLEDFSLHWPTQGDISVQSVRNGANGNGAARCGDRRWRRLTEERAGGAKSVFHFDVPGSVAKSTHAGLPWLLYLRRRLTGRVHFWPFDGWTAPAGKSILAEVYPSLWSKNFPCEQRNGHQHDAYSIAGWMRQVDAAGALASFLNPRLKDSDREVANREGWILGVV